MNLMQETKDLICTHIPDAEVSIDDMTGTHNHLNLTVKSSIFAGKSLLDQHQIIMNLLKESLQDKIHAVKIKTIIK